MLCPVCKTELKKAVFYGVEIDYCPKCLGIWFDEKEFEEAKSWKDHSLSWIDPDLWEKEDQFRVSKSKKMCPKCGVPLYEVNYGDSDIKVDVCNVCHGIWLDRGEFNKIINYLETEKKEIAVGHYFATLAKKGGELFVGPDSFFDEMNDFMVVLDLLNYKIAAKYPKISQLISAIISPLE